MTVPADLPWISKETTQETPKDEVTTYAIDLAPPTGVSSQAPKLIPGPTNGEISGFVR